MILHFWTDRVVADQPVGLTPRTSRICQLWRYDVSGQGGQPTTSAELSADAHFPVDRKFAVGAGNEEGVKVYN